MHSHHLSVVATIALCLLMLLGSSGPRQQESGFEKKASAALIDGTAAGWKLLKSEDFVNINCKEDTWQSEEELIICNGIAMEASAPKNSTRTLRWSCNGNTFDDQAMLAYLSGGPKMKTMY